MRIKKTVTIGTVGAGYPAYLHGNGLEKVGGVDVRLKTICDTNLELAQKVMDRYYLTEYKHDWKLAEDIYREITEKNLLRDGLHLGLFLVLFFISL